MTPARGLRVRVAVERLCIRGRDPLQTVNRGSLDVMLPPIPHVGPDPIEIAPTEAHHAVPGLPLKNRLAASGLVIDMVRRGALQLTDEFAGPNRRRNRYHDVDVRLGASDFVNEQTVGVDELLLEKPVNERFDRRCQQRRAVFRVPNQMEVDFAVVVAGHDGRDDSIGNQNSEKAPEGAWCYVRIGKRSCGGPANPT